MNTPSLAREAMVPCLDSQGRVAGVLRLVQSGRKGDSIRILSPEDSRQHGEESIQLVENHNYDFELLKASSTLRVREDRVVKPSAIRPTLGRIETGLEAGLLHLVLEDVQTGAQVACGAVEIVSAKLNYRTDYRAMLRFIADECSELLFDIRAGAKMRLKSQHKPDLRNLQRQIEFLAAELTGGSFVSALQRIMAMPHQKLQSHQEEQPVARLRKGGRDLARQIGSARSRVSVPPHSGATQTMQSRGIAAPSLPRVVSMQRQVEFLDTPENRFVKHVLTFFRDFLRRMEAAVKARGGVDEQRLLRMVRHLQGKLSEVLSARLFKDVSTPAFLPIGSPVLQRKGGYREVLTAWLRFDLASELVWEGGEDVFGAGKRDVSMLFEYWLFFQLLRLFQAKFDLAVPAAKSLFEHTHAGLSLRLKAHETLGIEGKCQRHDRRINVRFSYNLTQEKSDARAKPGSWTLRMRPDFTLTFWPDGFDLAEAEAQELAVHVHFDAKYRVETLSELFGDSDDDLDAEKTRQKRGNYKRVDLLKMHAYRDAIRRSEGAYILYPGTPGTPAHFQGFHEILPGLGAFALRPGAEGEALGLPQLSRFVDEVIDHLSNRATARERSSYHEFNVYREDETRVRTSLFSALPERDDDALHERSLPPAEHSVLVGWCDNETQMDWIRRSGLYNFRAGLRQGSIRLEPAIADARHLLLHGPGGKAWPGLWRVTKRGPRLFTNEELHRQGYPSAADSKAVYAVFDVEPDPRYAGWSWDYARLPNKKRGFASATPFSVSLLDVLLVAVR